jgi:protein TonB
VRLIIGSAATVMAVLLVWALSTAPKDVRPSAPAPVRLGAGIGQPSKTKHVPPIYPPMAKAAGVEGVVIIETLIDPKGRVQEARVLRSIALLDQAALDAVKQWEFVPTLLHGTAVPLILTVTVQFTLADAVSP